MAISPQVILFVLLMLTIVAATRLDEMRQHRRGSALPGTHSRHASDAVKHR